MATKFKNVWLADVIEYGRRHASESPGSSLGYEKLLDALYSLHPEHVKPVVQPILDFPGTKVLVSCTDQTPLETVLKQALCMADLVILVPAPLWVSCAWPISERHAEFNVDGVTLADCWNVGMRLLRNMAELIVNQQQAFCDGAVTFLPVLGEGLDRWSHPELLLPQLPAPYSKTTRQCPVSEIHLDALYGLCSERLAAERLGAIHLNLQSFTTPVLGDLTFGKPDDVGHRARSLVEIQVPDLTTLTVGDILRVRAEIGDSFSQFSRRVINVLGPDCVCGATPESVVQGLRASATVLTHQIESLLSTDQRENEDHVAPTTFILGLGDPKGNTTSSIDFLRNGGTPQELVRTITETPEMRLEIRENSLFAAIRDNDNDCSLLVH